MSLQIDNIDDLNRLLKASKLTVSSVDELKDLLATINASYNPDAARMRLARLLGMGVPSALAAAAFATSFIRSGCGAGGAAHSAASRRPWSGGLLRLTRPRRELVALSIMSRFSGALSAALAGRPPVPGRAAWR
jgi:hypothetical protein